MNIIGIITVIYCEKKILVITPTYVSVYMFKRTQTHIALNLCQKQGFFSMASFCDYNTIFFFFFYYTSSRQNLEII